jgi:transmembrane sensor
MNTEMNNGFAHIDDELLIRFLSEECNEEERQTVDRWLEASPENKTYFQELSILWNASASSATFQKDWLKKDWNTVRDRIDEIRIKELNKPVQQRSLIYTFARLAAVIVLAIGVYLYVQHSSDKTAVHQAIASAGIKTLTLPDGSKVSLNANAKLIYPEVFDSEKREVTLEGEAFFEILRDTKKPFRIKTNGVTTEVLGTSFNINSTADSAVVTVVTGKVMLYEDKHSAIVMTAGEQGIYNDRGLEKRMNSDRNFLSWKTNILTFQSTPLEEVVDDLSRHYGRHIQIESKQLEHCTVTSTFRQQTLEEVLEELKVLFALELSRSGDIIMLKGKGC